MLFRFVLAAALLAASAGCRAEPQRPVPEPQSQPEAGPQTGLEVVPLRIRTSAGTHNFRIEVARTEEQQARGMMFREQVGPDEGMLFPFVPPRPASFWMKNTLIPLDMLFIRADGTIARIAAMTVPHSLEPVAVGEPVAAVLELGGGRAAALGIAEGDRASWPGGPAL